MAILFRSRKVQFEACVDEVSNGLGGRVFAIGFMSQSLDDRKGSFRIGPFVDKNEARRAIESGIGEMFGGRDLDLDVMEGTRPGWFAVASLFIFPSLLPVAAGAVMTVAGLRALDAGKPPRAALQRTWDKRRWENSSLANRAEAPLILVKPSLQAPRKNAVEAPTEDHQDGGVSGVVNVTESITTAPWRSQAGMKPIGFLKATWLRRPSGLDYVLNRIRGS